MTLSEEDVQAVWEAYWADRSDPMGLDLLMRTYAHLAGYYARMALAKAPAYQDRDDILSYAQHGLMQAIERYEPDRGAKFETWAARVIPRRIMDRQRTDDPLTRNMRSKVKLVTEAQETWIDRMPTITELADHLKMTEAQVREALTFQQSQNSNIEWEHLDDHVSDSEAEVLVHMAEARAYVAARLAELGPRQRAFALAFYCDPEGPKTLVQACRDLGISPDWARQTKNQVLDAMRR